MSLVAFSPEETVQAFGETLTLRLDFRAVTIIEYALDLPFPLAVAQIRSGACRYTVLGQVLWAILREHHSSIDLNQCLTIVMEKGDDGSKVGFALDALLDRALPMPAEDRDSPNPPKAKRSGRSRSSAAVG